MLWGWLRRRRRRRMLALPVPNEWEHYASHCVPGFEVLSENERETLQTVWRVIVTEASWEGCRSLIITDEVKVTIAAQAALLLLNLEHDYFSHVPSILVYPDSFVSPEGDINELGVVEEGVERLGEAWYRGPVILSWEEIQIDRQHPRDGRNVVLHEFAHQLDFLDGLANGTPPLKKADQYQRWHRVMTREYHQLARASERGDVTLLDDYGAESPSEMFAVATECFFERPIEMEQRHRQLYRLLSDYFGQDPASRWSRAQAVH